LNGTALVIDKGIRGIPVKFRKYLAKGEEQLVDHLDSRRKGADHAKS
jgi:hypothetical protein